MSATRRESTAADLLGRSSQFYDHDHDLPA
jgi:hypothetical protein